MRLNDDHMVQLAEAVIREDGRRRRDLDNAIEDFRSARDDGERVRYAGDLMTTTRMAEHRFVKNMADESVKLIEQATGKSMEDLLTEGMAAFGIGLDDEGKPKLIGMTEDNEEVEVEADVQTTPSGEGEIPGIDMDSLDIDFAAIEAEFRGGDGA